MATEYGIPCPIAGCKAKTEVVALVPLIVKDQTIPPHRYAVCKAHYKEQWAQVYGEQFGGISHDDYLKKQAAGEPGF